MCPTCFQMRTETARQHPTFWCFIFTTMISTGKLPFVKANQEAISLPELACYIEYERTVDRCSYSLGNFSNGYITQNFNGSEGVWNNDLNYVNISINYPTGFNGILQVAVLKQFRFSYVLLQIDMRTSLYRDGHHPSTLKVSYLPYNLNELSVRQLAPRRYSYLTEDPCNLPDSINGCTSLISNSKLTMKSKKNSIELKLNHPFRHPLKVELYGRVCRSSCDDMYPPCPTNLTSIQWLNPMTEFTIPDLKSAYYCARVIYNIHDQDCCSIFTETASVHHVQWMHHSAHNFHLSTFFYVMLAVLFLTVVVAGSIHFQYCRGIVTKLRLNVREYNSKESTQLVTIQELDPKEIEILLLYPKKDKLFMNSMTSFRKLLNVYTKRVMDPLEDEQIEKVALNPARWMQRVLMIPDLKIVLVETEEAVSWFYDENRTLDVSDEDLYFSAISFLHNQPELIFNYRRLLVVRFDNFNAQTTHSLTLVPQKRYNMPHQLGLLLMDIINCHEYSFESGKSPDDTVSQFYRLTEEYQRSFRTHSENIKCT